MADPTRRVLISMACNDPRNGVFAGKVEMIEVELLHRKPSARWSFSIESRQVDGLTLTVDERMLRLRIARAWFPFVASRDWVGNWCWNAYTMRRPAAVRLLQHLRAAGWTCTEAPTHVYEWFNRKKVAINLPARKEATHG